MKVDKTELVSVTVLNNLRENSTSGKSQGGDTYLMESGGAKRNLSGNFYRDNKETLESGSKPFVSVVMGQNKSSPPIVLQSVSTFTLLCLIIVMNKIVA